jgi:hypothetical protein
MSPQLPSFPPSVPRLPLVPDPPSRPGSAGLMLGARLISGKPIVYRELPRFYGLMQKIASEVPKVPRSDRPFEAT